MKEFGYTRGHQNFPGATLEAPRVFPEASFSTLKKAGEGFSALSEDARGLLPHVRFLLTWLLTMPASTATADRSFSALRRLKTWLRSTTSQKRLNAVVICHIHKVTTTKCTDPGHARSGHKWPHLIKSLNVRQRYTDWTIALKLSAIATSNSVYKTYILEFRYRWPKVRSILWPLSLSLSLSLSLCPVSHRRCIPDE